MRVGLKGRMAAMSSAPFLSAKTGQARWVAWPIIQCRRGANSLVAIGGSY